MKHFDRLNWTHRKEVASEREDLRTFFGKVFANTDGTLSLKSQLGTPVHYREETLNPESPFLDIDITPRRFSDRYEVDSNLYRLTVADTGEVRYTSRAYGDVVFRPHAIGGNASLLANRIIHQAIGVRDFIVFEDIRPGVDMLVLIGSARMEPLFRIKTAQAPREFTWEMDCAEDCYAVVGEGGRGWEETGNRAKRKLDIAQTKGPPAIANGRRVEIVEESWTGDVLERGTDRQITRKQDAAFPLIVDPPDVTEQIVNGADDVVWRGSVSSLTITNTGIKADDRHHGGIRFRTVAIPNAQVISAANLKIAELSDEGFFVGGGNMKIVGDDVDDAPVWSGNGPAGITDTSNTVTFVPLTGAATAPQDVTVGVANIVQEIVNRAGWASNNDMRFAVRAVVTASAGDEVSFAAYEHATANPARLEVTFVAGGPFTGTIAQTAPSATQSATAVQVYTATIDQTAPSATQRATDYEGTAGIAQTAPSATQDADAIFAENRTASIAQTAPRPCTQSATALFDVILTGASIAPSAEQAGTIIVGQEATIAQTGPSPLQSATAHFDAILAGASVAPSAQQSATAMADYILSGSNTAPSVFQGGIIFAPGDPELTDTADLQLPVDYQYAGIAQGADSMALRGLGAADAIDRLEGRKR